MDEKRKNILLYVLSGVGAISLSLCLLFIGFSALESQQTGYHLNQHTVSQINAIIDANLKNHIVSTTSINNKVIKDKTESDTKPITSDADNQIASTKDKDKVWKYAPFSKETLEACEIDIFRLRKQDGLWVYLIEYGDTLAKLSKAFGYSVDELANFNQIRDVNLIYANSSLRIPNK